MTTSLVNQLATEILSSFEAYLEDFNGLTRHAGTCFVNKNWDGLMNSSQERLSLYKKSIQEVADSICLAIAGSHENVWPETRERYLRMVSHRVDHNIAKTYFNSVYRRACTGVGIDENHMFSNPSYTATHFQSAQPIFYSYQLDDFSIESTRNILEQHKLPIKFEDINRDAGLIYDKLQQEILIAYGRDYESRIEVLKSVFYRNKSAYLMGRVRVMGRILPFIVPILHGANGLYVDTLLLVPNEAYHVFSYARSYFMAEVEIPSEVVTFLQSFMPLKKKHELYSAIGFYKHGKTKFFLDFSQYQESTDEKLELAPGSRGMTMVVFNFPGYDMVFKVIRDRFHPAKKLTEEDIKSNYEIVYYGDRLGRMAQTMEFDYFAFDRDKFSPELLAELQEKAPSKLEIQSDKIIIKHLYLQRKLTPLNLYLKEANVKDAKAALDEYGNAIKQLAAADIFPGELQLENFGVTRFRRVVFYDYDQMCYLKEINFREVPAARHIGEYYELNPWFATQSNDVFPEEFKRVLIGLDRNLVEYFKEKHGDLFDLSFLKTQQKINFSQTAEAYMPYKETLRFQQV
ncbi:MAG: bifunctional isocitrate dehydrogenase kinase/phosphatase [Bacteroidota bacterium]